MDDRIVSFAALIDSALEIATRRLAHYASGTDPAPRGALEHFVRGLHLLRDDAVAETLEPSEGVVTIGLLRAIGDWGEPPGSELLKAVQAIERYYLENM